MPCEKERTHDHHRHYPADRGNRDGRNRHCPSDFCDAAGAVMIGRRSDFVERSVADPENMHRFALHRLDATHGRMAEVPLQAYEIR